jgi:hypothetical protein
MHEALDHARLGHRLHVQARLAELDPAALELADAKARADKVVEPDAAGERVSSRAGAVELDPVLGGQRLARLGLDQRQLGPRGAVGVPVFQPRASPASPAALPAPGLPSSK